MLVTLQDALYSKKDVILAGNFYDCNPVREDRMRQGLLLLYMGKN